MDDTTIVLLVLGTIFLLIVWNSVKKYIEMLDNHNKSTLKLQKAKVKRQFEAEDEEDAEISGIPVWLSAAAQGAGLNVSKIMSGDTSEIAKALPLLEKMVGKSQDKGSDELIS